MTKQLEPEAKTYSNSDITVSDDYSRLLSLGAMAGRCAGNESLLSGLAGARPMCLAVDTYAARHRIIDVDTVNQTCKMLRRSKCAS